ncbi:hypothetical protein BGLA2_610032 [Burkholderia gladioli]|nr:hypothetical protein BGLA2_610032 [Burkholderia gladioli]
MVMDPSLPIRPALQPSEPSVAKVTDQCTFGHPERSGVSRSRQWRVPTCARHGPMDGPIDARGLMMWRRRDIRTSRAADTRKIA